MHKKVRKLAGINQTVLITKFIGSGLYRNPEILILDATSASEPRSEEQVQETLEWFHTQGKTIIIIAHRMKMMRKCNPILVLDQGILVETGNNAELLVARGKYFEMNQII